MSQAISSNINVWPHKSAVEMLVKKILTAYGYIKNTMSFQFIGKASDPILLEIFGHL